LKKLFDDGLIERLKKLPEAVTYLLLAASFFFKNMYSVLHVTRSTEETFKDMLSAGSFSEMLAGQEISPAMMRFTAVLSVIIVCVFSVLIFELIARLVYSALVRRAYLACDKKNFCIRVRLAYFYANVVLGLFGLVSFGSEAAGYVIGAVLGFAVPTIFLAVLYEDLRKKVIQRQNHFKVFDFVAKMYLAIYLVLAVMDTVQFLFAGYSTATSSVRAAYFVDLAIRALFFVPYYYYGNKLKVEAGKPEDNPAFIVTEEEKKFVERKPFDDLI